MKTTSDFGSVCRGVSCGRPMGQGAGYGVLPCPAHVRSYPGTPTFFFTSFRQTMAMVIPLFVVVAVLSCGGGRIVEVTREVEVIEEVEVTRIVEVVATASPVPTPGTVEADTVAPDEEQEGAKPLLEVPDRGYNSLGSPDAPITMFDFSDFT